jgi:hypothetical protein
MYALLGRTTGPGTKGINSERDALICAAWGDGTGPSLEGLAVEFDLSIERVSQILKRGGVRQRKRAGRFSADAIARRTRAAHAQP